jgi:N-methylhydantoinase B/oxoprolinase/acetone carboxylase alpha subunit
MLISKNFHKTVLQETRVRILKRLSELPHADHELQLLFETGEAIRLRTDVKAEEVHFDFTGTTSSKRLFLTDVATFGICMAAFLSLLGEDLLLNQGLFSILNVTTPQDCFLNARYPAPVTEGAFESANLLATAIVQSLSSMTLKRNLGLGISIPTVLSFEFSPQQIYFDPLLGGSGATSEGAGLDGYSPWSMAQLQTSVEEIERLYPLRLLQSGVRQGSGGKGKSAGGNGILREIEVQADCTLRWLLGQKSAQIKGFKDIQIGLPSEITIFRANGEQISIQNPLGQLRLCQGDRVLAASAGGGGIGKISN